MIKLIFMELQGPKYIGTAYAQIVPRVGDRSGMGDQIGIVKCIFVPTSTEIGVAPEPPQIYLELVKERVEAQSTEAQR